jgi:hypothetical protein
MTSIKPNPEIAKIYEGLDPTQDLSKVNGDPVFGFYPRPEAKTESFLIAFSKRSPNKFTDFRSKIPYPEFDRAITIDDLENLKAAAAGQEIFVSSSRLALSVMNSSKAFSDVTKSEFAKAYVEAIQQPQCAGFYALVAISRRLSDVRGELGLPGVSVLGNNPDNQFTARMVELASVAYNLKDSNPSDFVMSGQYFRAAAWEAAPLTADEVLAMPFILGEIPEVYAEVEHDLGRHAESCAKKLESAGYPEISAYITKKFELEAEVTKPQRKHEDPGLGM